MENSLTQFKELILRNKTKALLLFVLTAALALAVYLVQIRQIFHSKASPTSINDAFTITEIGDDGTERRVDCTGISCDINSLNIKIQVDMDQLVQ